MKLGSLFDGVGGFPLAAQRHEIEPVWASEVEKFPIEVTKKHFPNMRHLGDITKIKGNEIEPVDIITAGSPCQDLSVAGKRAGLEGARSGLFMEFIRIVREMREATNNEYPRFIIWENVPGAFSSNSGNDFRAVLEEIAETKIPMPKSGRWADAGMVRGHGREIAWRCLDAQYWGVPQRRKRIFLVCDFRGAGAGEILFEQDCLRRDIEKGSKKRKGSAGDIGDGVEKSVFYESGKGWISEGFGCLRAEGENRPSRPTHTVVEHDRIAGWVERDDRIFAYQSDNKRSTVQEHIYHKPYGIADSLTQQKQHVITKTYWDGGVEKPIGIIPFDATQITSPQNGNRPEPGDPCHTLYATAHIPSVAIPITNGGTEYLTGWDNQEKRVFGTNGVAPTLSGSDGGGGRTGVGYVAVPAPVVAFQPGNLIHKAGAEPSTDVFPTLGATTLGDQLPHVATYWDGGNISDTLDCSMLAKQQMMPEKRRMAAVVVPGANTTGSYGETVGALCARDFKGVGSQYVEEGKCIVSGYAVRRLTPTECERLQGFPDGWTSGGADTARYKALGNSLAVPCVEWIMSRIAAQQNRAFSK